MNCKPGDLAVVVFAAPPCLDFIGRIIRVKEIHPEGVKVQAWRSDPPTFVGARELAFEDDFLRPIRPDETPEQSIEAMTLLTQSPQKEVV